MKSLVSQSFDSCPTPGNIGFPSPLQPSAFPPGGKGSSSGNVRGSVTQAASSSHKLAASSQYIPLRIRTEHRRHSSRFDSSAPSLGFAFPHDDMSKPYRCRDGPSSSRHLPSLTFLTPPTVCATTYRASLFHPAAASRIHSLRAHPPHTAATSRRRRLAFLTISTELAVPQLPTKHHAPGRRLQGFAPCESPLPKTLGFSQRHRSLPSSFPSSRFRSLCTAHEV